MSLPIVNGTLIETADEPRSRPMASVNGFHSGFARTSIFRRDEVFGVPLPDAPGLRRNRASKERFSVGGVFGAGACVEFSRTPILRKGCIGRVTLRVCRTPGLLASGLRDLWKCRAVASLTAPDIGGRARLEHPQILSILNVPRPRARQPGRDSTGSGGRGGRSRVTSCSPPNVRQSLPPDVPMCT